MTFGPCRPALVMLSCSALHQNNLQLAFSKVARLDEEACSFMPSTGQLWKYTEERRPEWIAAKQKRLWSVETFHVWCKPKGCGSLAIIGGTHVQCEPGVSVGVIPNSDKNLNSLYKNTLLLNKCLYQVCVFAHVLCDFCFWTSYVRVT